MSDLPPANWYPDPEVPGQQRYWDGTQWTEHRAPLAGSPAVSGQQQAGWDPDRPAGSTVPQQARSTNGLAVAAMIIALVSLPLAIVLIGGLGGVLAVILGIVALRQVATREGQGGRGMAITGVVVGALAIAAAIVLAVVYAEFGSMFEDGDFFGCTFVETPTGVEVEC